jgi:HK97 family phage major capsid protein
MPSQLLERLVKQRAELGTSIANLYRTVEERAASGGDDHLSESECKTKEEADVLADDLDERIRSITAVEEREAAAAALALTLSPQAGIEQRAGGARVTNEPKTYHERGVHSWVADILVARYNVPGLGGMDRASAEARLQRHAQETAEVLERDSTTATFSGLVPPQYLVGEFTPNLRAGRPFANILRGMPLPPVGMSIIIPRATAGTTIAIQATQGTNPSTTDMAVTDLTVPMVTFQGRGVISRQSAERGAVGLDRVVFDDLAADAARFLDQQALYGTGSGGNALGAINTAGIIAVTQTGTTGLDTIKAIANSIQSINTQRFLPPNAIVMHPRRWGALTIAVDSSNRPLVTVEAGAMNVFGQGEAAATQQVVGSVQGLPVITDPNLRINLGAGTNQDEILVVRREDLYLWEQAGTIREFTFEQPVGPANLQLAVYGNAAFTAARYPTAVAYISGVGLVTPTF